MPGFDRTPPKHQYAAHVEDWREGDPDWGDGRGRGIIGALNYLAQQHVNSIYFLTMNVGGDGKDVWPWVGADRSRRAARPTTTCTSTSASCGNGRPSSTTPSGRASFCTVVFNEAEDANKRELDDGELGPERKLYYREMIARFGHHLAMRVEPVRGIQPATSTSAPSGCARLPTTSGRRSLRPSDHRAQRRRPRREAAVHFRRPAIRHDFDPTEPAADPRSDRGHSQRDQGRRPAAAGQPRRVHARPRPAGVAHSGRRRRRAPPREDLAHVFLRRHDRVHSRRPAADRQLQDARARETVALCLACPPVHGRGAAVLGDGAGRRTGSRRRDLHAGHRQGQDRAARPAGVCQARRGLCRLSARRLAQRHARSDGLEGHGRAALVQSAHG